MFAPLDIEWKDRVAIPAVQIIDGHVRLPDGPGLGISLDGPEMALHPYVVRDLDLFAATSILSRTVRDQGHDPAGK